MTGATAGGAKRGPLLNLLGGRESSPLADGGPYVAGGIWNILACASCCSRVGVTSSQWQHKLRRLFLNNNTCMLVKYGIDDRRLDLCKGNYVQ